MIERLKATPQSNKRPTFFSLTRYIVQVIDNTLNPVWKPFDVAVQKLCNGDLDRTVKVIIIYVIFLQFAQFLICVIVMLFLDPETLEEL